MSDTDNKKDNLLLDYINRVERKLGADSISLQVNSETFSAIDGNIRAGSGRHPATWKGYPITLCVGMADHAVIDCTISDADDNVYAALLPVPYFEGIET